MVLFQCTKRIYDHSYLLNKSSAFVEKSLNHKSILYLHGSPKSFDKLNAKALFENRVYKLSNKDLLVCIFNKNSLDQITYSQYKNENISGTTINGLSEETILGKYGIPCFKGFTDIFGTSEYIYLYAITQSKKFNRNYFLIFRFNEKKLAKDKVSIYGFENGKWKP
jgi:hypothetical protein